MEIQNFFVVSLDCTNIYSLAISENINFFSWSQNSNRQPSWNFVIITHFWLRFLLYNQIGNMAIKQYRDFSKWRTAHNFPKSFVRDLLYTLFILFDPLFWLCPLFTHILAREYLEGGGRQSNLEGAMYLSSTTLHLYLNTIPPPLSLSLSLYLSLIYAYFQCS